MEVSSSMLWQRIGTVSGLLGTVLTLLVTWIKDRTAASRRIQLLDEATRYLAFWRTFMEATNALSEDEATSMTRLYAANMRLLAEYVESACTQPIRQSVLDASRKWVRREAFKAKVKAVVRTFVLTTGIVFLILTVIIVVFHPSLEWILKMLGITETPTTLR
jgi:hypothetical protein